MLIVGLVFTHFTLFRALLVGNTKTSVNSAITCSYVLLTHFACPLGIFMIKAVQMSHGNPLLMTKAMQCLFDVLSIYYV